MKPRYLLLLLYTTLQAADWPQWRGPASNAISNETALPTQWSATENIAWKAKLAGLGVSSPIVIGDRVFVTSQIGKAPVARGTHPVLARDDSSLSGREHSIGGEGSEVTLVVEAFNRKDGKRLWDFRMKATGAFPELHEKHNLATPTPTSDGERVYAWFGNGQLVALDMAGHAVWQRHLGEEISPFKNPWGHGSSPTLYKDTLILLCDHSPASYLLALDKRTGKQVWKADRGSGHISHSTPLVIPTKDGDQLIVNSTERIDAFDPANGKPLWHAGSPRQTPIPTAVFHEGLLYLTRGYRNSDYMAMRPGVDGDVSETNVKWKAPSGGSYVPSILYYEGMIYVTNEVGIITCADAETGARLWQYRTGGVFFASPVAADKKIYFVSETGETFVMQSGREAKLLSKNDIGERLIASPAISQGRIFLRSDGALYAIGK